MNSVGFPELLIILVMLVLLVIPIWAIIDAASRPEAQWTSAGQSRRLWLILLVGGSVLPVIGVVFLVVYLASVRPKLKQA